MNTLKKITLNLETKKLELFIDVNFLGTVTEYKVELPEEDIISFNKNYIGWTEETIKDFLESSDQLQEKVIVEIPTYKSEDVV